MKKKIEKIILLMSIIILFVVQPVNGYNVSLDSPNFNYTLNTSELEFSHDFTLSLSYNVSNTTIFSISYSEWITGISNFTLTHNISVANVTFIVNIPENTANNTYVRTVNITSNVTNTTFLYFNFNITLVIFSLFPSYSLTVNGSSFYYTIYNRELPFIDVKNLKISSGINDTVNITCNGFLSCANQTNLTTSTSYNLTVTINVPTGTDIATYKYNVTAINFNSTAVVFFNFVIKETPVILYNITNPVTLPLSNWSVDDFEKFFEEIGDLSEARIRELIEADNIRTVIRIENQSILVPVVLNETFNKRLLQIDANYQDTYDLLKRFILNKNIEINNLKNVIKEVGETVKSLTANQTNVTELVKLERSRALEDFNQVQSERNTGWRMFGIIFIISLIVGSVIFVVKKYVVVF